LGLKYKFFDADPGYGMEKILNRDEKKSDPGWKKVESGMEKSRIRDPG
jgi:hypothetical protein